MRPVLFLVVVGVVGLAVVGSGVAWAHDDDVVKVEHAPGQQQPGMASQGVEAETCADGGDDRATCGASASSASVKDAAKYSDTAAAAAAANAEAGTEAEPERPAAETADGRAQGATSDKESSEASVDEAMRKLKQRQAKGKIPQTAIIVLGIIGIIVFNVYKVSSRLRQRQQERTQQRVKQKLAFNKERENARRLLSENERKVEQMTQMLAAMQNNISRELRNRQRAVETLTEFSAMRKRNAERETTFT
ncbi:hypothetical protein PTSG_11861 [Salpingoeca rosetta]|uniref:Transmembrane protein n=1 Tax=Salpingoeca rosetta (strain ATCC 50818 / BSB-021) TaxID=946362 RepID=F2U1Q4_SALR5|nr:uncharacterized protein PTSG_11861 [Salpingoeca rosetta]EGD81556.1 hypothetical protein PTSG_11861 [Salpingoeca rosetta]|eukprot:XP_004996760.1 hypothetical protein PTSG_11861 [Salpingoeca rosetta]